MAADADRGEQLAARVAEAAAAGTPLRIEGSGSKAFYGRAVEGEPLPLAGHRGIVAYEPAELYVTARAGTPLAELEEALAARGQRLGCEPPRFGGRGTVGGMVAAGLSGPRRPWSWAVRDVVLGVRCVNGRGEILTFGGRLMKNVAGFDAARLMAGSLGTLAVLLEVTLRVDPVPEASLTVSLECGMAEAIERLAAWGRLPLPLAGACHLDGRLHLRLEGAEASVREAAARLGGEARAEDGGLWAGLRDHALPFFSGDDPRPLWRLSLPPATPPLPLPGDWLLDWGGAQRWLRTDAPAGAVRAAAERAGGHATCFRGEGIEPFHPLPPAALALHRRIKAAFDPAGILNPGRMHAGGGP